tara:strand:- start:183 stop:761 length:579 start_codon:yes stop_codon:yes gene_type:complete
MRILTAPFITLLFCGLFATNVVAQNWEHNISGTVGLLNAKIRLQYERPLGDKATLGCNMNYYLVNWTGPVFEPFGRIYGKKDGNTEGFFAQGKIMFGSLSIVDYDTEFLQDPNQNRWWTFGMGAGGGYKSMIGEHFNFESIFGIRLLAAPTYRLDFDDEFGLNDASGVGEVIGWGLTTGFPLDIQLKFGYQF